MIASPEIGLIGVLVLLLLLLIGTPIGVSLGIVGIGGIILILGFEPAVIKSSVILFEILTKYELGTIPLFMFVAHMCFSANASRDFFDAAAKFVGHKKGGLALASIAGCAGFGAINGSSLATAATIGLVALPEMRKRGYDDGLATGAVAAGGTLGSMIPPAAALIVYGIIAEQSIGKLFTAAILPVFMQIAFYMIVITILVTIKPQLAPRTERAPWKERFQALGKVADMLALIFLMIGGISIGWFTPSESASIGGLGAIIIAVFRGRFSREVLSGAIYKTLKTSGMIITIITGALLFSVFISLTGLTDKIGEIISTLNAPKVVIVFVIAGLLLLLGSVLDGLALMLLTTPILLPIILSLGLSPIWFAIFLVKAMEIGFIHPPIGMNLYVIQSLSKDVSLGRVFMGVLPFLLADLVQLALIIIFPAIALYLPSVIAQ